MREVRIGMGRAAGGIGLALLAMVLAPAAALAAESAAVT